MNKIAKRSRTAIFGCDGSIAGKDRIDAARAAPLNCREVAVHDGRQLVGAREKLRKIWRVLCQLPAYASFTEKTVALQTAPSNRICQLRPKPAKFLCGSSGLITGAGSCTYADAAC